MQATDIPPEIWVKIFGYAPHKAILLSRGWYRIFRPNLYSDPYYTEKISWKRFHSMLYKYPEQQLAEIVNHTKFVYSYDDNFLIKYAARFNKLKLLKVLTVKVKMTVPLLIALVKIACYAGHLPVLKQLLKHPQASKYLSLPENCTSIQDLFLDQFTDKVASAIFVDDFYDNAEYYERLSISHNIFSVHLIVAPVAGPFNDESKVCLLHLLKQPYLNVTTDYNYLLEFSILHYHYDIVEAYLKHPTADPTLANFALFRRSAKPKYRFMLKMLIDFISSDADKLNRFVNVASEYPSKKRKIVVKCLKSNPNVRLEHAPRHKILSQL